MTVILGVDVGYSHTKTFGKGVVDTFKSTVFEGSIDINTGSTVIEWNSKEYTVGDEQGQITVDTNKIHHDNFKLCLIAAILRNSDEQSPIINVNLVTGLPVSFYKNQKDELVDSLKGEKIKVRYKGVNRVINIKEVIVFPQSAGLFILNPEEFDEDKTNLIVDIGGITTDVSYFVGVKLTDYKSYENGMIKLYSHISGRLNSEYNIDVSNDDIVRFINAGGITIGEKLHEFDFDAILKDWFNNQIVTRIKTDFPYDTVNRRSFIGGGSLRLKDYVTNKGIKADEVMSNAQAFYEVGVQKFE